MGLLNDFLHDFSNIVGTLSGPGAEFNFRLSISFSISCAEKLMSTRLGRGELSRLKNDEGLRWGFVSSGFEKAEAYWSASIWHISAESVINLSSIFSGPIDSLVICFLLAKEKKCFGFILMLLMAFSSSNAFWFL